MRNQKRKLTSAERRKQRERNRLYMTVFIHGCQKRVPRPLLINGMSPDELIAQNADPIWLHQNEMWELLTPESLINGAEDSPPLAKDDQAPF